MCWKQSNNELKKKLGVRNLLAENRFRFRKYLDRSPSRDKAEKENRSKVCCEQCRPPEDNMIEILAFQRRIAAPEKR